MIRKKIHKDLLIRKTQKLLSEYLDPMLKEVDKPRRWFAASCVVVLGGCGKSVGGYTTTVPICTIKISDC